MLSQLILSVIMHLKKHTVFKRNKAETNTCIICGRITGESKVSFFNGGVSVGDQEPDREPSCLIKI